ncbi:prephenate dehydratase [Actinomyces trachealis]|uniref:prephenate dehydratase n=1 Tax=Actinomyces trachealis TaxID=2763540 RepID=UPI001892C0E6|nr:prephenate dehydratase [Actinomyces trachealis]
MSDTAKWSFLGPTGTFCEMALRQVAPTGADGLLAVDLEPCQDVPTALDRVRDRSAEAAVVPIENSIEGGVNATLDNLVTGAPLVIAAEVAVPITFVLAGRPGTQLAEVAAISTHPHAWAQCRGWVHHNLPKAIYVPGTSTSAPAKALAAGTDPLPYQAVLCNPLAANSYGLEVLAAGVADNPDALTRFVKVTRPGSVSQPTGADKTTLLVQAPYDRAGALLDMLSQFAARGVNLTRIESRPTGDSLGRYRFSIDVEGHIRDERVAAAFIGLHRTCPLVRFLGSYPRLDDRPVVVPAGTSNKDFTVARAWLAEVLEGRTL